MGRDISRTMEIKPRESIVVVRAFWLRTIALSVWSGPWGELCVRDNAANKNPRCRFPALAPRGRGFQRFLNAYHAGFGPL
jgi:hypothetical protein